MARWRDADIPEGGHPLVGHTDAPGRPEDLKTTLFWRCGCGEEFNLHEPREAACPHGIILPDGTVQDPPGYDPGPQPPEE
jgi:hypothetical protein